VNNTLTKKSSITK